MFRLGTCTREDIPGHFITPGYETADSSELFYACLYAAGFYGGKDLVVNSPNYIDCTDKVGLGWSWKEGNIGPSCCRI